MTTFAMQILVGAYFATLAGLAVFGSHRYLILWLFHRHRSRAIGESAERFASPPPVTAQLPLFNEMYVARRLIDAAAALDYPRDRLQIQVLDDSTDETRGIVDEAAAFWNARGVRVDVVRRADRAGFKAGALEHGLASATGDFIAVFDADFTPRPDFLARLIDHFTDPDVGMVQARWEYFNENYSLLTRLQALFLDGHFVLEHAARNRSGRYFNFNGTAGIWRKAAIADAGGWQHDTITEDLDLSYRAQMRGWRFVYRLDVGVPSELPVLMSSFRTQQHRWAKGSIETAFKLLPRLWRSNAPLVVKLEATTHLTSNLAYGLVVALCLLSGPSLVARIHMGWRSVAWVDLAMFFFVTVSIGVFYLEGRRQLGRSRLETALILPMLMAMGIGMAINNGRAVIEGLTRRSGEFIRTPKHRIETRHDRVGAKKYRATIDGTLLLEVALLLWFIPPIEYVIRYEVWASLPFQLLFAVGFAYVAGLRVIESARPRLAAWLAPGRRAADKAA